MKIINSDSNTIAALVFIVPHFAQGSKCAEEQLTAGRRGERRNSGQVSDAHAIGSIGYDNLGMFTIIEMAAEITDAVSPLHHIPGMPYAPYLNL